MKKLIVLVFSLLFIQQVVAQWQMLNSPLATPEIKLVASHPEGYIFAITNQNEVFRKDTSGNQWNKISVLDSTAYCISISPDGIIYIGTKGGYFYSLDYGHNWIAKTILAPNNYDHYVSDIEFGINGYIYLSSYAYGASGVWISSDSGISWSKYTNGLDARSLVGLEIDSMSHMYVITAFGGIFKSIDNGINWELSFSIQTTSYSLEIDNDNNVYVGSSLGIYKSSDSGNNWSQVYYQNGGISKLFVTDGNIYALRGGYYGIIHSTDAGTNWENFGLVGYLLNDIDQVNNTIYVGTKQGLRETADFGNNWSLSFKYDDTFVKVNDLLVLSNSKLLTSTNEGVFTSTDNGMYWNQTRIIANTKYIFKDNSNNLYALSDSIYKSIDFGETWTKFYNSMNHIFINDSNQIFVTYGDGSEGSVNVQRSTDQGNSWHYLLFNIGVWDISAKTYKITQLPSGSLYISYREWGVYHPGNYWVDNRYLRKYQSPYNWSTVIDGKIVQDILVNDSTMYLSTQDAGIFKSYDEGYTLIPMNTGLTSNDIRQIIKTPEDVLICLASNGVFRSLDNGNHWASLGINGLLSTAINSIYYYNGMLYASTNNGIGVFIGELPVELSSFTASVNQNKVQLNWETATELNNNSFEVQRKLENADWITIGFVQGNGTTTEPRSYTYFDEVSEFISNKIYYRLKQIDYNGNYEFSDEIEVITLPLEYSLSQNYPNPFNPITKIKYEIPENTNVTLEVFDVLGKLIKTLVNENKSAGRYEVEFNASELSSGLYLYKISAGGVEQTRKMLLLK